VITQDVNGVTSCRASGAPSAPGEERRGGRSICFRPTSRKARVWRHEAPRGARHSSDIRPAIADSCDGVWPW